MKYLIKILIVTLFITIFSKPVLAAESGVRGAIVIPADWRDRVSSSDLQTYRQDIYKALIEIQGWYANRLSGHTFARVDPNVVLVYSDQTIDDKHPVYAFDAFNMVGGYHLIDYKPSDRSVVWAIWIIGSNNAVSTSDTKNTFMNHTGLINLNDSADIDFRNSSKGNVAHELGHSFGLVYSAYSKAHPCSVITDFECTLQAPKPYPVASETLGDIMGRGAYLYPNTGIQNTTYNPEVQIIYRNSLINPNHDPAPTPVESLRNVTTNITGSEPNPIEPGTELTINGLEFGVAKGSITLAGAGGATLNISDIKNWANNSIKIIVPQNAISGFLTVRSNFGDSSSKYIDIKSKVDSTFRRINVNVKLTCGSDNLAVREHPVTLTKSTGNNSGQSGKSYTDLYGLVSTYMTANGDPPLFRQGDLFQVTTDSLSGLPSDPTFSTISVPKDVSEFSSDVHFHFAQCSPSTSPAATPFAFHTSTPTPPIRFTLTPTPPVGIPPTFTPTPTSGNQNIRDYPPVYTPTSAPQTRLTLTPTPAGAKTIVSLRVNGQDFDARNIGSSLKLTLPGTPGKKETLFVPVEITYSNGQTVKTSLNFLYDPSIILTPTIDRSCNSIGGSCAASNGVDSLGRTCTTYQSDYSASCAASSQVYPYCYTGCLVPTTTPTAFIPTPTSVYNSCNSIGGSCAASNGVTSLGRTCTTYQSQFNSNCSNPYPYCYTNCSVPSPTPSYDCASINGRCATSDGYTGDNYKCSTYQGQYSNSCKNGSTGSVYPYCYTNCQPR